MGLREMRLIKEIKKMIDESGALRKKGERIGFVPTMGYLHEGHLSLIKKAREECSTVIVSVFINPLQFGPNEDLDRYPRDLRRDCRLAEKQGVDYVFNPEAGEMYGADFGTTVSVEKINKIMCGKNRPIHFDGVCTVVLKLFNIVKPHVSYFGEKDYQQLVIIKKMVRDLNVPVRIEGCPVVRERDGLAMSSRNRYMSPDERKDAAVLYGCLKTAAETIKNGNKNLKEIKDRAMEVLSKTHSIKIIDYFEFRNARNLDEIYDISKYLKEEPDGKLLISSALWIGKTRIIDNIIIGPDITA